MRHGGRGNVMKHTLFVLAAFGSILPGLALARQQVLPNGSYEFATPDGEGRPIPNGWNSFGGGVQSADVAWDGWFSGLASVRTNAYVGLYCDTVTVGANTRIVMKARAYHPAAFPIVEPIKAGMKLEFLPPEGLELPPPVENLAFDVNAPHDQWVLVTVSAVVPNGVTSAKAVLISFEFPDPPDVPLTNGQLFADSAFAALSSNPSVNLLSNASFESGTSGQNGMPPWVEFADPLPVGTGARKACLVSGVPAHSGNCVVRFTGGTAGLFQEIPVTPGETLTVSAYFRTRGSSPYNDPRALAGVKIEWSGGSWPTPNIDVVPNANPISGTTNIITAASPTDTWLPISIDYTIPPNKAARLRATVINAFGPGSCDVYFDAFEMVLTNVFDGSDVNADNAADLIDIATLQRVYTGPGAELKYLGLVYDHNENGALEPSDVSYTLQRMTGPVSP